MTQTVMAQGEGFIQPLMRAGQAVVAFLVLSEEETGPQRLGESGDSV